MLKYENKENVRKWLCESDCKLLFFIISFQWKKEVFFSGWLWLCYLKSSTKNKKKNVFSVGVEGVILLSWPQGRGDVIPFGLTWGIQYETPSLLIVKYFRATKEKNWFRTKECHLNFYGTWSKCSSFELSTSKGEKRCNFLQYQY